VPRPPELQLAAEVVDDRVVRRAADELREVGVGVLGAAEFQV
jgi:hypothetical protein